MADDEGQPQEAEPAVLQAAKQPDRLVAFIWLLEQDGVDVQSYVDRATEINLAEVPTVPEVLEWQEGMPEGFADAHRVHTWALAVSGSTAKVRHSVSQLGLSDGQAASQFDPTQIQPDRISDVVAEVADRVAREVAESEKSQP